MMQQRTAIFRVDASSAIGGGHLMRCRTLAMGLTQAGWECRFAGRAHTEAFAQTLPGFDYTIISLPDSIDGELAVLHNHPCNILVIDQYALDAAYETASRRFANHVIAIDDRPSRPHMCDVLLDQNYARTAADYAGLVQPNSRVLTGLDYCLLRPEIRAAKVHTPYEPKPQQKLLLTLGASDPQDATAIVLAKLAPLLSAECSLDAVIGPGHPRQAFYRTASMPHVTFHMAPPHLPQLMAAADLAIVAMGTACWELAFLGTPMVVVWEDETQRLVAEKLAADGMAALADSLSLLPTLRPLLEDATARAAMAARASQLVDGQGVERFIRTLETLN